MEGCPPGPPIGQDMPGPSFPELRDTQVPAATGASPSPSGARSTSQAHRGSDLLESLRTHCPPHMHTNRSKGLAWLCQPWRGSTEEEAFP